MPHVVKQGRESDEGELLLRYAFKFTAFLQHADGSTREMVGAERMLEPCMRRTGVDEEGVPELPHVAEPLKRSTGCCSTAGRG